MPNPFVSPYGRPTVVRYSVVRSRPGDSTTVLGASESSDPHQVQARALQLILETLPRKDDLFNLWNAWDVQHVDWPVTDTLWLPLYFSLCQLHCFDCILELNRRLRCLHRPVFTTWMGLIAGPRRPDTAHLRDFLGAMDSTLQATVHRRLDKTSSQIMDEENVALLGAIEEEHRGQQRIVELFRRGGNLTTKSGQCIKIPTIPASPIRGMEEAHGKDAEWRNFARDSAIKVWAALAPGHYGVLETALSDAAHAAQRAERGRAESKKQGGSGGPKAKKAGTEEPPVQHVRIGDPQTDPT